VHALVLFAVVAAGCEATMPPPPPAIPAPPPSGKPQLDDADLERALAPAREWIALCQEWFHVAGARPEAVIDIDPSGRVTGAAVHRIVNLSQRRCIERDLRLIPFPAFTGPPMRVVRVFSYSGLDAPAVPPLSSGKAQLDDADIRRSLAANSRALEECSERHATPSSGTARVTISPSGRVTSVVLHGVPLGAPSQCVERALQSVPFPTFSGPTMTTTFDVGTRIAPQRLTPSGTAPPPPAKD
jgi:hypothetical protein